MPFLLQQLLARSVERDPEQVAVISGADSLSYRELARGSERLARLLASRGVKKGDRVGIYLHKSIATVVAIFGILKAGAAYVPLDPHSPAGRLAFIIRDCGIRCLLSSRRLWGSLAGLPDPVPLETILETEPQATPGAVSGGIEVIPWDADPPEPKGALPEPVESDLAYILYTSGSTGEPKGVMISHLGALTFVRWAMETFEIDARDRLSNHAPFHFDLSIFDLFVAIGTGATLVIIPEPVTLFPARLAEYMAQHRISVWYSVPSALIQLLTQGHLSQATCPALRLILFAGEVFPVKYLRLLRERFPDAGLFNLYGPTETNVCTFYQVDDLPPGQVEPVPIGKACANTEVFALNEHGRPIATGEEGELYVRGSSLMLGYWNRPEKTAEVLGQNPLQPDYPDRVYRTGDQVRLERDGNYSFLGRRDHMIKSRGYRIELGEIEARLYAHPAVKEAVAIAVPDEEVGNRIKAVIVMGGDLSETDLKRFCAEGLPRYMVPDFVEFRDALPKTSTGKVDRKLLGAGGA